MAIRLRQHPKGPQVPDALLRPFRSYVDLANAADRHGLPDGVYFVRPYPFNRNPASIREARRTGEDFWVEGRGHV